MGIKLSDYINDENRKLTPEQVRQFLIDYGFDDALEKFDEKLENSKLLSDMEDDLDEVWVWERE